MTLVRYASRSEALIPPDGGLICAPERARSRCSPTTPAPLWPQQHPASVDPTHTPEGPHERQPFMALADRITEGRPTRVQGLPCSVGTLLDTLPNDEAAALRHMLGNGWSQRQIFEALTDEGHVVGLQTINRHRSRACRCFL